MLPFRNAPVRRCVSLRRIKPGVLAGLRIKTNAQLELTDRREINRLFPNAIELQASQPHNRRKLRDFVEP